MAISLKTTEKPKLQTADTSKGAPRSRRSLLAFVGGMVAALPLTVAAAVPIISNEVSAGVAQASRPVQVKAADALLSDVCAQPSVGAPSGGLGGGAVLGASTANPTLPGGGMGGGGSLPGGGKGAGGGGNNQTPPPVIQRIVNLSGSITGPTGPNSVNVVKNNFTENTTVTNTNTLSVSNSNSQTAKSGSAEVEGNTTGGSAVSGTASNQNSSNFSFNVTN